MGDNKEEFDGYAEARKIDEQINDLILKYPIVATKESNMRIRHWRNFARTIRTSCELLETTTREKLYEDILKSES